MIGYQINLEPTLDELKKLFTALKSCFEKNTEDQICLQSFNDYL
jgi:hypothetical protein